MFSVPLQITIRLPVSMITCKRIECASCDVFLSQVQQLEGSKRKESIQSAEEMVALQKENEQLKEVLSAVQVDLETKTEV